MALVQTQAPAVEPVTLEEAKLFLRVDDDMDDDDNLISLLIAAARRHGEMVTGRSFITQGWRLVADCFPYCLELDRGTVKSVESIQYLDMGSVWRTVDPQVYVADLASLPERITPVFGQVWPIPLPQISSVRVDYTAGYGDDGAAVPEGIRQWILLRVSTLYEHREEAEIVARGRLEPMPFVDGLLDPYRAAML
jgi:uncharacterized phiE125 gp8 family phage protein